MQEEIPRAGSAGYDVARGGLRSLTRTLCLELAPDRINVNNLAPGMVLTPMNQAALDDPNVREEQVQSIPWKRAAEPWAIARLAVYLASDDANYVSGQTFTIDGGLTMNLGQGALAPGWRGDRGATGGAEASRRTPAQARPRATRRRSRSRRDAWRSTAPGCSAAVLRPRAWWGGSRRSWCTGSACRATTCCRPRGTWRRTFRSICPTCPGSATAPSPGALDVPGLAEALAAWLGAVGLAPAALLGNSFGCQIIVDLAARHPELVARAVLQGPTTPPDERSWLWQFVRWRQNQPFNPDSLGPITWGDYRKCGYGRLLQTFRYQLRDPIEDKLPRIAAPTLVVRGALDPICGRQFAEDAVRRLPRGRLVEIPEVAHTLVYTAPAQLAAVTGPSSRRPRRRRREARPEGIRGEHGSGYPMVGERATPMRQRGGRAARRWITVGGLRIHYRVWSGHGPVGRLPVVLVHGFGVSSRYMVPLGEALARDFRVYAPDLPGFGRSEQPADVLDISGLAEALASWMAALGLGPAVLIGNSLGCQVIVEVALRHSERVACLVLQGPTPDPAARSAGQQVLRQVMVARHDGTPRLLWIALADFVTAAAAIAHHLRALPAPSDRGAIGSRRGPCPGSARRARCAGAAAKGGGPSAVRASGRGGGGRPRHEFPCAGAVRKYSAPVPRRRAHRLPGPGRGDGAHGDLPLLLPSRVRFGHDDAARARGIPARQGLPAPRPRRRCDRSRSPPTGCRTGSGRRSTSSAAISRRSRLVS